MNVNSSNFLFNKILTTIDNSPHRKITFCEYMNMCLYFDDYGYYHQKNINIGKGGDFYTSASISSDFAELLAVKFYQLWENLHYPSCFHLVEFGAGEGVLALNIINFIKSNYPNFYKNLVYIIIEKSKILREKQKNLLNEIKVKWLNLEDIDDDFLLGCVFSNELIDAFPVHLIEWKNKQVSEIYLTRNENKLIEISGELSTNKIEEYLKDLKIKFSEENGYPENYRTEVNLQAIQWLKQVSRKLKQGYLLTIDYGYTASKYYHPQRYQGTLKCYYQHRHHNNPYVNIGCQDITSHVNFTALDFYGQRYGFSTIFLTSQALFLMELGLGDRLQGLSSGKISAMEVIQRRSQLHELINPHGLGGFQVLLQEKT